MPVEFEKPDLKATYHVVRGPMGFKTIIHQKTNGTEYEVARCGGLHTVAEPMAERIVAALNRVRGRIIEDPDKTTTLCPFCDEGDFDLVGLKMHFENGWCEVYERTVR